LIGCGFAVTSNHTIFVMRKLYIDCRSGASGDMFLGAFVDLGVPEKVLVDRLASLGLNEFALDINKREYKGYTVTDVDVVLYDKENAWTHPYSGKYRNYAQIKEILNSSDLSDNAKALARKIFDIKAEAESTVHGVAIDEVQFHEVGAIDSIVDITGAAICCDYLNIDKVSATSVPTGYGTILCAVGELPVPPPAVREILDKKEIPHYRSDVEMELLTPTGASILAGIVDEYIDNIDTSHCDIISIGRGTGKRESGLEPLTLMLVDCK